MSPSTRSRRAFTLIELLVVIGILAVLLGLLLAAVQQARAVALRLQCLNNLHQIGLALHSYHDSYAVFPPGVSYQEGTDPHPFMSWNTRLLPYLERGDLWNEALQAFAQDPQFINNPPHTGLATVMRIYSCPADRRTLDAGEPVGYGGIKVAFTSYLGLEGTNQFLKDGLLFLDSAIRLAQVTDGTSQTLFVGERPPSADEVWGWWYAGEGQSRDGSIDMVLGVNELYISSYAPGCPRGPYQFGPGRIENECDAFHFWSLHAGGANSLFVDGSARFFSYAAASVMPALATRAGGEVVELPD
jgi:prepilin-type N-terminal cleavage/methylation domain-containing protein/prepilin-type processing-associated H-X9-DG protein